MPVNIADTTRVEVRSEISIHEVLTAALMFAEKYPADRLSYHQADMLREAANMIADRVKQHSRGHVHTDTPDGPVACVICNPDKFSFIKLT